MIFNIKKLIFKVININLFILRQLNYWNLFRFKSIINVKFNIIIFNSLKDIIIHHISIIHHIHYIKIKINLLINQIYHKVIYKSLKYL